MTQQDDQQDRTPVPAGLESRHLCTVEFDVGGGFGVRHVFYEIG